MTNQYGSSHDRRLIHALPPLDWIKRLAVAMIPRSLKLKSGNHEAGRVRVYVLGRMAFVSGGNWSQMAIFYYDKTFELTGAHFSTNRICSPEKDSNQVVGELNLSISPDISGKTIKQETCLKPIETASLLQIQASSSFLHLE